MNQNLITAALAAVALSVSGAALAQSNAERAADPVHAGSAQSFTHGESKRCESMTGSAKEQCDKEEASKAEGAEAETADTQRTPPNSAAAAGGNRQHFTHGESERCRTMTGAAKDQCDKQEATK
jgi:hypothetical protein